MAPLRSRGSSPQSTVEDAVDGAWLETDAAARAAARLALAIARACEVGGNLSISQYLFLTSLRKGSLRPSWIAEASEVSPQRVTQSARILEERGLIARKRDSDDGRALALSVTPAGRRAMDAVGTEVARALSEAVPVDHLDAFAVELLAIKRHGGVRFRERIASLRAATLASHPRT